MKLKRDIKVSKEMTIEFINMSVQSFQEAKRESNFSELAKSIAVGKLMLAQQLGIISVRERDEYLQFLNSECI